MGLGFIGFRVPGLGFRVWGLGFGAWGLGFAVELRAAVEVMRQKTLIECFVRFDSVGLGAGFFLTISPSSAAKKAGSRFPRKP